MKNAALKEAGLWWVRWERHNRYHAVYVTELGLYWTYCSLSIRPSAVREETPDPPAICHHCRMRVRSPFLVPDELREMRQGQGLAIPGPVR
jgi:hypothetical protein